MKKPIHLLLRSLLFATATLAFADDTKPAPSTTTDFDLLERLLAPARITRGMAPQKVHEALGSPNAQLAPNVWAYWDFKAKDTPFGDQFDAALVIFADNRVKTIKLCDSKTVRAFIAQREAKATNTAIAAK